MEKIEGYRMAIEGCTVMAEVVGVRVRGKPIR